MHLLVVILCCPLWSLWQNIYLEPGPKTILLTFITVTLYVISLSGCVLLGNSRSRMIVPAAFVFSIIGVAEIPAVCFIAVAVQPLLDIQDLLEIIAQFPQLWYTGLTFNNVIITVCCLLAARWLLSSGQLGKTPKKPSLKISALFSLAFIFIALIVSVWWKDIVMVASISLLSSGFLGTLLLGIILLLFYLYTRLSFNNDNPSAGNEHIQFVQLLSKRELEVIEAILAGNDSYKKLAASLNISVNTIKTHLKHIYQTTGVSNIPALSFLFRGYTTSHP